jgi:type VI secretion system secreted protein Hcp
MASMKVFMKIDGMPGSSTDQNHADWCDVRGFDHLMEYPFDMRENKGRGEPVHGGFQVTLEIDKAAPKMFEALAKKKKVKEVEVECWRDNPSEGGSEKYFTFKLKDCRVVSARPYMPTGRNGAEDSLSHMADYRLAYREIEWTWLSGGQVPTTFNFTNPDA